MLVAISCCDLTTLEPDDTPERIRELAKRAISPAPGNESVPQVAALCTWPRLISEAMTALRGSGVKVASVAADFPTARAPLTDRLSEIESARAWGAHEIDAVADRELFLAGKDHDAYYELVAYRRSSEPALLKVILETGELTDPGVIRRAALIAMAAGADMIKTSTGKKSPGATLEGAAVIAIAISDFHRETERAVGLKVAGGIRSADGALAYIELVRQILGAQWLNPSRFRIGASSLLAELVDELSQS